MTLTYAERQAQLRQLRAAVLAARDPEDRLEILTSMLSTIAQLTTLAPTAELRAAWLAQYRGLQPELAALRATLTENPPGAFLRTLDGLADRVVRLADAVVGGVEGVSTGVQGIASGAGGLVRVLPLIALALLVVLAVGFFKGTLRARVG